MEDEEVKVVVLGRRGEERKKKTAIPKEKKIKSKNTLC